MAPNEVGRYRRTFMPPAAWAGRRVFLACVSAAGRKVGQLQRLDGSDVGSRESELRVTDGGD